MEFDIMTKESKKNMQRSNFDTLSFRLHYITDVELKRIISKCVIEGISHKVLLDKGSVGKSKPYKETTETVIENIYNEYSKRLTKRNKISNN